MKKIEVRDASNKVLDWAMAQTTGRAMRDPIHASNDDVKNLPVPFTLYEVNYVHQDTRVQSVLADAYVSPIKVTRYGINRAVGATAPSITFRDEKGREALGSVRDFYLSRDEALLEAQAALFGYVDDYSPTTDWGDGGPLIDSRGIMFCSHQQNPDGEKLILAYFRDRGTSGPTGIGSTHLIAGMRCILHGEQGPVIEVPCALAHK